MEKITKTKCPDNERLDFLPNVIGPRFLQYERLIYTYMDKASKDYHGGFWDYYSLSNGGFYMAYNAEKSLSMSWEDNYFEGVMGADSASIGINLMVQNAFAWEVNAERFTPLYHTLRDFAAQHEEAAFIFRFID